MINSPIKGMKMRFQNKSGIFLVIQISGCMVTVF